MEPSAIVVSGARVHNLKNISFEIPHNAITVVTGVSGSGKSSLAFDTIYAEGQRRYIESLSAYARQFLERIEKPDVDEISGIAPAIAIKQKNSTRNPRSTVATATEIYDYLRLLYARAGRTFCTRCGAEVRRDTIDEITARVLALEPGRRFYVLFRLALPEPRERSRREVASLAPRPQRRRASSVQQALARFAEARIQPPLPGRPRARILFPGDFAGCRFLAARLRAGGSPGRSRPTCARVWPTPIEICYREGSGEAILEFPPLAERAAGNRTTHRAHGLQRALRVQDLRPRLSGAGAAPVFVQQSLRRLPALPGIRQHHRFRSSIW